MIFLRFGLFGLSWRRSFFEMWLNLIDLDEFGGDEIRNCCAISNLNPSGSVDRSWMKVLHTVKNLCILQLPEIKSSLSFTVIICIIFF